MECLRQFITGRKEETFQNGAETTECLATEECDWTPTSTLYTKISKRVKDLDVELRPEDADKKKKQTGIYL